MQKINFQNLPDTTTPVNATNLNALQTNVENAIGDIVEEGTWTPTIGVLSETDPTVTYTIQTGKYKKIGNIVFFSFIIRANITTLNGTNNYAVIKGLPYYASVSSVGDYACPLGSLYSALSNTSNAVMCPYDNYLRVQTTYGSSAGQWIVTPTTYMEIGGSGFYFTG